MKIVPLTLAEANRLIAQLHRHHKPVQGHRFGIGLNENGVLIGAATIGRPVGREVPQYTVAEVTRLVTDGTPNACSMLYGAAAKAAKAMGFWWIQTYILEDEPGTSLKAAGWQFAGMTGASHRWTNRIGRRDDQPVAPKQKWIKVLNGDK